MLDDLLGAAHMRRDLGDRLDDQVQVADRDALGEQQLQHRLQAGIGDVRGADLVGELAVFRVLALEQRLHVLVGQKLRQVVADDLGEVGEQHRHVVGEGVLLALQILGEHLRHRPGAHAEGRLAHFLARDVRRWRGCRAAP